MKEDTTNLIKPYKEGFSSSEPIDDVFTNQIPTTLGIDDENETSDIDETKRYFDISKVSMSQPKQMKNYSASHKEIIVLYRVLYLFFISLGIIIYCYFQLYNNKKESCWVLFLTSLVVFILYVIARVIRVKRSIRTFRCKYIDGEYSDIRHNIFSEYYFYYTATFETKDGAITKNNYKTNIEFSKNKRYTAIQYSPSSFVIKQDGLLDEILLASGIMLCIAILNHFYGGYIYDIIIKTKDIITVFI